MVLDNKGTTLMEILVSVAIIGILSSVFLVNIRTTDREKLTIAAEQLAADLRQIRNMAFSRSVYDMNGILKYPQGGYGIAKSDDTSYLIYADKESGYYYNEGEDELIKKVNFDNINISSSSGSPDSFYFNFIKDHEIDTNLEWAIVGYIIILELSDYGINIIINYNPDYNGWGNIIVGDIYE